VRGNIGYGLRIQKAPADLLHDRVDELLELMQLTRHADKRIDALSGGQRQRVALARALAPQPRVLLLDEPLTALDAKLRDTLRTEMNALLRGLGITTVYVTHDQAEAMALGDRIVVMSAGRIEQIGTPRDIYYRPGNLTVARFVGTLNQLDGELHGDRLATVGGVVPLGPTAQLHCAQTAAGRTALYFRPEDAVMAPLEDAHLRGVVETAQFLGERTRLRVSGAAPELLTIDVAGYLVLSRGTAIGLNLRHDALFALA
jgi:putative spermidine/putrescine transport system ATP-binding protein